MAKLLDRRQKMQLLDEIAAYRENKANPKLSPYQWQALALKLNIPDGAIAKACYYSLRDTYRKIKKQMVEDPEFVSHWPYYEKIYQLEGAVAMRIVKTVKAPTREELLENQLPDKVYHLIDYIKQAKESEKEEIREKYSRGSPRKRTREKSEFWNTLAEKCDFANGLSARATYQQLKDLYFRSLKSKRGITGSKYYDLFKKMDYLNDHMPNKKRQSRKSPENHTKPGQFEEVTIVETLENSIMEV